LETTSYKATDLIAGDVIPRPDGDLTITKVERLDDGRVAYECGDRRDTLDSGAWVHIVPAERPPEPEQEPEPEPAADGQPNPETPES